MSLLRRRMILHEQGVPLNANLIKGIYKSNGFLGNGGIFISWGPGIIIDYIAINPEHTYEFYLIPMWDMGCFYDKDCNYVDDIKNTSYTAKNTIGKNGNIKIPVNARYVRLNTSEEALEKSYFIRIT